MIGNGWVFFAGAWAGFWIALGLGIHMGCYVMADSFIKGDGFHARAVYRLKAKREYKRCLKAIKEGK